jgi:CRP/FNR family transcriptional regulator, cyclic AMP receptor protein
MADAAAVARNLLAKSALFARLDERNLGELAAYAQRRSFASSELIFRFGDVGLSMLAIVAGTVRISLTAANGREIILADLVAGELFGEIAMLDGKPRSANATAITKCDLLVLERRYVIPFLESNPKACLSLMETLCARIRRSDERMTDIAFFDLPARLAKVLLSYPGKTRGQRRLSLSQTELAEMAGGTRENVNRCLRDWQRRGIVELDAGWTVILNSQELTRVASRSG